MSSPDVSELDLQREVQALRARRRQSASHMALMDPDLPELSSSPDVFTEPSALFEHGPLMQSPASDSRPLTPTDTAGFDEKAWSELSPIFGSTQRDRLRHRRQLGLLNKGAPGSSPPLPSLPTWDAQPAEWAAPEHAHASSPPELRTFLREHAERHPKYSLGERFPSSQAIGMPARGPPRGSDDPNARLLAQSTSLTRRASSLRKQVHARDVAPEPSGVAVPREDPAMPAASERAAPAPSDEAGAPTSSAPAPSRATREPHRPHRKPAPVLPHMYAAAAPAEPQDKTPLTRASSHRTLHGPRPESPSSSAHGARMRAAAAAADRAPPSAERAPTPTPTLPTMRATTSEEHRLTPSELRAILPRKGDLPELPTEPPSARSTVEYHRPRRPLPDVRQAIRPDAERGGEPPRPLPQPPLSRPSAPSAPPGVRAPVPASLSPATPPTALPTPPTPAAAAPAAPPAPAPAPALAPAAASAPSSPTRPATPPTRPATPPTRPATPPTRPATPPTRSTTSPGSFTDAPRAATPLPETNPARASPLDHAAPAWSTAPPPPESPRPSSEEPRPPARDRRGFGLSWFGLAKDDDESRLKKKERADDGSPARRDKDTFLLSLFSKRRHYDAHDTRRSRAKSLFSSSSSAPAPVDYSQYARYSVPTERALYRLSHVKLTNPRRPLLEQVVISNLMFWYLSVINSAQARPAALLGAGARRHGPSEYDDVMARLRPGTPPLPEHVGSLRRDMPATAAPWAPLSTSAPSESTWSPDAASWAMYPGAVGAPAATAPSAPAAHIVHLGSPAQSVAAASAAHPASQGAPASANGGGSAAARSGPTSWSYARSTAAWQPTVVSVSPASDHAAPDPPSTTYGWSSRGPLPGVPGHAPHHAHPPAVPHAPIAENAHEPVSHAGGRPVLRSTRSVPSVHAAATPAAPRPPQHWVAPPPP